MGGAPQQEGRKYEMWVESFWDTRSQKMDIQIGPYRIERGFSIGMTIKSSDRAPSSELHGALNKALGRVAEEEINHALDESSMREDLIRTIVAARKLERDLPAIEAEAMRRITEGTDVKEA